MRLWSVKQTIGSVNKQMNSVKQDLLESYGRTLPNGTNWEWIGACYNLLRNKLSESNQAMVIVINDDRPM